MAQSRTPCPRYGMIRQSSLPIGKMDAGDSKIHRAMWLLPPRYKDAYTNFYEGIAFVKDEDGHKIAINNKGNFLFEAPYDAIYPFHNGLAEIRRNVHSFSWSSLAGAAVIGSLTNAHYDEDADYGLSRKDIKRGYINTQ